MARETAKIPMEVEGKEIEFEFYLTPNVMEETAIKNQIVELIGGWDNLSKLDASINQAYQANEKLNSEKFGSQYVDKLTELETLQIEKKDEEFDKLFDELYGNTNYKRFLSLQFEKNKLKNYAHLQVMVCQPKGYNFFQHKSEFLDEIVKKLREKMRPFRPKTTGTEEVKQS
jgi:hypothetical protein